MSKELTWSLLIAWILGIALVIGGALFWLYLLDGSFDKWQKQESFLAEKYNFTEEECVEWQNAYSSDYPYQIKECSLYCHQVQIGENCTNKNKTKMTGWINRNDIECKIWTVFNDTSWICYTIEEIEEITCTPIYERGECQKGDDVREARELIG